MICENSTSLNTNSIFHYVEIDKRPDIAEIGEHASTKVKKKNNYILILLLFLF